MDARELIPDLDSEHEEVRLKAIAGLVQSRDAQFHPVLEERAKSDASPLVRYHARKGVEALTSRRSSDQPHSASRPGESSPDLNQSTAYLFVQQKVDQVLQAGSTAQRRRLLEALTATRDRRYLPLLDRVSLSDPDRAVRKQADRAFLELEATSGATLLPQEMTPSPEEEPDSFLAHPKAGIRSAAVGRLARNRPDLLLTLAPRYASAEQETTALTVWIRSLAGTGNPRAATILSELIRRNSPPVRARAARTWLHLQPEEAIPFVVNCLDDPDELVRDAAFIGLVDRDEAYAVELLEGRVGPARLAPSLRSIQCLARLQNKAGRESLLRLLDRQSDGRLLEPIALCLAQQLPSPELQELLALAARNPSKQDLALATAEKIRRRDHISEELFTTLLSEYGFEPAPVEEEQRGSSFRARRRFRKTVASLALAVSRGTQAISIRFSRRATLAAGGLAIVVLGSIQAYLLLYPAYKGRQELARALALYDAGEGRGSQRHLGQALSYLPESLPALARTADLSFDTGDLLGATDALALVRAVARESGTARRLAGRRRLAEGDPVGAVRLLEEALLLAQDEGLTRLHLGEALIAKGDKEQGLRELQTACSLSPRRVPARLALARALAALGRPEDAGLQLNRLLEVQPNHPGGRQLQGEIALSKGNLDRATQCFRIVLESHPGDVDALLGLGQALEALQEPSGAREAYDRILRSQPSHLEALLARGRLSANLGDLDEARASFNRALELQPDIFEALFAMGRLELEQGSPEAAVGLFERASARDPESVEAIYNLGLASMRSGQKKKASAYLRAALDLDPARELAWLALGYLAHQEDRTEEAQQSYERALELNPSSLEALVNLGALLIVSGDRVRATALLRQALTLAPDEEAALHNLALLNPPGAGANATSATESTSGSGG